MNLGTRNITTAQKTHLCCSALGGSQIIVFIYFSNYLAYFTAVTFEHGCHGLKTKAELLLANSYPPPSLSHTPEQPPFGHMTSRTFSHCHAKAPAPRGWIVETLFTVFDVH